MVQLQQLGTFWKFSLRCFFGELGDKTFFLTVLLTAWVVTWESVPHGRPQRHHQLMVLAGALSGLLLHVVLVSFSVVSAKGSSIFNFISVVLLVSIGIKLHFQVQSVRKLAEARESTYDEPAAKVKDDTQAWNTAGAAPTSTSWNNYAARAQPPTEEGAQSSSAQGYGSMNEPEKDAWGHDAVKDPPQEEQKTSFNTLIVAGLISMALIFVIEVAERSQYSFLASGESKGTSLVLSSMLGYTVATCFAVFVGYLMESMMKDEWLLFTAEMAFFAMALISLSQAVLGLSPLSMQAKLALMAFGVQ